ncbi:sugar transporter [Neisseria gonorrhoeae]|uniref:Sugar transporter n=1 Tax=Neisseria gonorrhoeae TaxID=485 RepID=A0A378W147_NEIGO|nr:sugar transporter [Neisseria gonorrhoeae]
MSAQSQNNHTSPLVVLTTLFFMMGFITCMNDILIPHLKEIFDLSYVQAMLIQFCFFTAYAVMSIPMGAFVGKVGYKNGVIGGFLLTAVGCLLFILLRAAILTRYFWARCLFGFRRNAASGRR